MANEFQYVGGDAYVSKSGSDVTGDGTPDNPYLTYSEAEANTTFDDVVVMGHGVYNEVPTSRRTLIGDAGLGQVIFDGTGFSIAAQLCNEGRNIEFRNYSGSSNLLRGLIQDCRFINVNKPAGGISAISSWDKCLFKNCNFGDAGATPVTLNNVTRCTFHNCVWYSNGLFRVAGVIRNNVFGPQVSNGVYFGGPPNGFDIDFNVFDPSITRIGVSGVYTTPVGPNPLADYQANDPTRMQNSIEVDPQFNNLIYEDYTLAVGSPAVTAADDGGYCGAYFEAIKVNANTHTVGYSGAAQIGATDAIELTGSPSGTATFQSIDISGLVNPMGRVLMYNLEDYPLEVVDTDNTTTNPNQKMYELSIDGGVTWTRQFVGAVPQLDRITGGGPYGPGDYASYNPANASDITSADSPIWVRATLRDDGIEA